MDAGGGERRRTAAVVLALAALALALAGAHALDSHGFEVVAEGSVASVLAAQDQDDVPDDYATLVTTEQAVRALEAGLVDGDRLPADRPPLLVARVEQQGAGSWCTSASAEVATAPDGTISVTVSQPWWRRLPTLECMEDVPATSAVIVALDERELAAAPTVELTGGIVTPTAPFDLIVCRRGGDSGWVCQEELH